MKALTTDTYQDSRLYCRVTNRSHPELREGERWVSNVIPTEEFGVYDGGPTGTFRIFFSNQRLGEVAYDVHGNPVGDGYRPLFTTDPPGDPSIEPVWTYSQGWKRNS